MSDRPSRDAACQCEACSAGKPHASDCAVHSEPAYPNGPCDCGARTHKHVWDTETDELTTFTPDPGLDQPWVIHECIEVGCLAIKVTRVLRDRPVEIVYEESGTTPSAESDD